MILTYFGATAVTAMRDALPMDGLAMKTLFTVGGMLPCVGIAILLRQIVNKNIDFVPFFCRVHISCFIKTQFSLNNDYCASFCCNFL